MSANNTAYTLERNMYELKLGAHDLPAAEVVLVKTLFRLFSHDSSFRWTFANRPPYDALLVDGTKPENTSTEVRRMTSTILRLTRMNSGSGPNTLERPIRADQLQHWLSTTEQKLLRVQPNNIQQAPQKPAFPSHVRFKLLRWPSGLLLRGDSTRIRMATLLSRRALSARELSVICEQPVEYCEIFLQVLRAAALLKMEEPISAPPAPAPTSASTPPPQPKYTLGLISSIRRRLGL